MPTLPKLPNQPTPTARCVLLADPDPGARDLLCRMLGRHGYEVLQAADGAEMVSTVQAANPDLVLLDILLPTWMDGVTVLRAVRAFSDVPIIVLTALANERVVVVALDMGADDYVIKPFRSDDLLARIGSVLRRAGKSTRPFLQTQARKGEPPTGG